MNVRNMVWQTFAIRWCRSAMALTLGVKLHPAASLVGSARRIHLGRGSSIGARSRLHPGSAGTIRLESCVWLSSDVELQTDSRIRIEAGTTIQRRCSIIGTVRIGRGCIIAPNVFISSGTHPFRAYPELPIRKQELLLAAHGLNGNGGDKPVWIQEDTWLGVNAVICPGVTVGKGSVIGANAVVTRDVPPYTVAAGVPARAIGKRLDWEPPARIDANRADHEKYFLSGLVAHEKAIASAGILVSNEEPLVVAVGAYGPAVCIHYRAAGESIVTLLGQSFTVRGGDGTLRNKLKGAGVQTVPVVVEISATQKTPDARFQVLFVTCEPLDNTLPEPVS